MWLLWWDILAAPIIASIRWRDRLPDPPDQRPISRLPGIHRKIEDVPVPAIPLGEAGPPQVARAGIIEERRRGGADVLSFVRGAPCSVAGREPAFAELDLDEDQAPSATIVLHVDRHVTGGELLVIGRLRPRALCQHVHRPLEFELDVDDSDG